MRKTNKKPRNNPWFRRPKKDLKAKWGFIPINFKGWIALILLIAINAFASNYFQLNNIVLNNYLKMGVVFLLSLFVFIEFARKKTAGVKND